MTASEMRAWTRHVLADLDKMWGGEMTWYAAVHQHTAHIHAHVIVAASRAHAGGGRQGTRFGREDFAVLRASGDHWAGHARREALLMEEADHYAGEVVRTALTLAHGSGGGGGGRGPTDRDEIEREHAERTRR